MLNASTHLNQIFQYVLSRHLTRFDEHNADGDKQIPLEKRVKKKEKGKRGGGPFLAHNRGTMLPAYWTSS